MNIAICDDLKKDAELLKLLCEKFFDSMQINITIFNSGDKLVTSIDSESKFDVIFLDIDMPGMNGIETGLAIRQKCKNIIIIFV